MNEQLEQPLTNNLEKEEVITEQKNSTSENSEVLTDNVSKSNLNNGSNLLGKFKDVNALEEAYNNLQAEFTKKCQKLKFLENEIKEKVEEKNIKEPTYNNIIPQFQQESFEKDVMSFIDRNPNAKQYAKEISLEIINDNSLNLNQAYERVLAKKYKEPQTLLEDENFLEQYIFNNEKLKKEMLKRYIKTVEESNVPSLINGSYGLSAGTKNIKISSLEEANKLAFNLFKN